MSPTFMRVGYSNHKNFILDECALLALRATRGIFQ